ncbi:hypothetical protein N0V93_002128 [Gnomoniopsis smithogilvyi]|uniref:Alpha/beta hydrolase fold-3 domain-containing protein n=1 Tax=Gnomoniopsis smithogilvyi TaxID=1191159 RepID=A0A9W8Z4Z6_9PEZI|nr:hypothetical protein N0V93_002128 [Gnomoniopsis smithogilvyi]
MFLYTFSPRQIQLFIPSTIDAYVAFIQSARARARKAGDFEILEQLQEDIEVLPDKCSHILWIGDRHKANKFVYFFHGGGYITPAIPGHFEWVLQAYVRGLPNADEKVAVAFLQYTLAPSARFPTQMFQAISGLDYLLKKGIDPDQLVVGGDSAGGNIALQLLTHLMHPYPLAERITLNKPLAGAFLVSPLVSGNTSTQSFREGAPCDMLSLGIFDQPDREMFHVPNTGVKGWLFPTWGLEESKEFKIGKKWALMADVEETWLDGMSRVVSRVYVTCGKHEILRDQGIYIAQDIQTRNPNVEVRLQVAEKEAHDFILLEGQRRRVGDATLRMRNWFSHVWQ